MKELTLKELEIYYKYDINQFMPSSVLNQLTYIYVFK